MMKHTNIPIFIPHFGCRNDCVFCNQRCVTEEDKPPSIEEVKRIIEEHISHSENREAEAAFFGGSFTGIEVNMQEEYLKAAYDYVKSGKIRGIRVSTRPDYINDDILRMLKKYGVINIELGVQSMCDDVLKASLRGHTSADSRAAAEKIKKHGFGLGLQMMIGLPEDSREKSLCTAGELVSMGADFVRIYPCLVLRGTGLWKMYERGEYKPLTLSEAVDTAAQAVLIFEEAGVPVIRIGLQQSEGLSGGVAAGPYHPSLGEMVISRVLRNKILNFVLKENPKSLEICAGYREMSKLVGQNRENIRYFKENLKIPFEIKQTVEEGVYVNGNKL